MDTNERRFHQSSALAGRWQPPANQILELLPQDARALLEEHAERISLQHGTSLFEPGDPITHAHFPLGGTVIALVLPMRDGRAVEAATIGREGAVGGIVSLGLAPAFARGSVQVAGEALRVPLTRVEEVKCAHPAAHDLLARYADCLTAQVLQSVACAALHPLEARCARWLLLMYDRLAQADLPLTQETLAETLGVARTYVSRMARELRGRGAISFRRGVIRVEDRARLEQVACECYHSVRQHFARVLPGLYPSQGS